MPPSIFGYFLPSSKCNVCTRCIVLVAACKFRAAYKELLRTKVCSIKTTKNCCLAPVWSLAYPPNLRAGEHKGKQRSALAENQTSSTEPSQSRTTQHPHRRFSKEEQRERSIHIYIYIYTKTQYGCTKKTQKPLTHSKPTSRRMVVVAKVNSSTGSGSITLMAVSVVAAVAVEDGSTEVLALGW